MLGIAAIPSLLLAVGLLKMPESPRWLIMKGRLGDAKKILYKVSNTPEQAEIRLRDIKQSVGINENCNDDIVKLPESTKTEAVILYSHKIFAKAGVHDTRKQILATVGVGLTKFTFIVLSTFLIDRVGRRKLLLISLSGMVVTLAGLGFFLTLAEHSGGKCIWALVLSIVTTYAVVMFFNIGLGPVTWVYSTEIFPLKYRALGAGIGVAVNRLMNATVSMSFLSLSNAITTGGSFFLFAGVSLLALIFFYFFCPETKGKSLEEMESVFTRGKLSDNSNK
ncbi:putative polyol transporter 6 [Capsicum annuum]|uniref:Polyol transporter 6 n=1 Tax=Capsicum annuum TaxID=4072 RepID=A0A2G3A9P8_CAPAN|nr:putative polyol transporter 6 [Capsicum annuum]KAF3637604.1 putative polyol transporter 6 [Capsicum annuum]PHT90911.1 putative polyol transporter 6 [Capsicum annuum]